MRVFQELFSYHKFKKSLNATFIARIPKIAGASESKMLLFKGGKFLMLCSLLMNA